MSRSKTLPKEDIAADLHRWATKEMHFRPQGHHANNTSPPTVHDYSGICKGQMADIWKFVMKNVHSAQTVRKVHGNLQLKRQELLPYRQTYQVKFGSGEHYDQTRADLVEKHRTLLSEITSIRSTVGHLERDLTRTQAELTKVDTSYQEAVKSCGDVQRKTALLKAHSQQVEEKVENIQEYKHRCDDRVNRLKHVASSRKGSDSTVYSKPGGSLTSQTGAFESACTKEVREACQLVGEFLQQLLQGTFGTDKLVLAKQKEGLWQSVERVVRTHPVDQVVLSLAIYAHDSAFDLRDSTANIDIKRDAGRLRFRYESTGHLSDLSESPSLLHSIHQLLEESQTQQIRSFIETEKSRNHLCRVQPRLAQAQELLEDRLREMYRDTETGTVQAARKLFDTELQIGVHQTAVHTLEKYVLTQKQIISEALRHKEKLNTKYKRIQDFKKTADTKQNLIRVLVKQNLNARSRLESHQEEMVQYMTRVFVGQDQTTEDLVKQLKDGVTKEVDAFTLLALPNLMFTVLDSAYKISVIDLSINRLSANQSTATGQVIHRLLEALEFPLYKAPDQLLLKVLELQTEVEDLQSSLRVRSVLADREGSDGQKSEQQLVDGVPELQSQVAECDQKQVGVLLPSLQKRLSIVAQGLMDCLRVKDTVQGWWEQPAQNKVPWVTVDDQTFQQWKDKWTVTVTRLRQLQLHQPAKP